ncbi:hypothetical protein BJY16_001579 [Actinoplanes octamycinicus]|uniref:Uncharacterized protein n=1 Tax=Actinoplanes octamycinicus TaxID=135948 RepID=A0A7W7M5W4_9ACTN|nr:hypothetical protein [Actinoplanes octamycinicus]
MPVDLHRVPARLHRPGRAVSPPRATPATPIRAAPRRAAHRVGPDRAGRNRAAHTTRAGTSHTARGQTGTPHRTAPATLGRAAPCQCTCIGYPRASTAPAAPLADLHRSNGPHNPQTYTAGAPRRSHTTTACGSGVVDPHHPGHSSSRLPSEVRTSRRPTDPHHQRTHGVGEAWLLSASRSAAVAACFHALPLNPATSFEIPSAVGRRWLTAATGGRQPAAMGRALSAGTAPASDVPPSSRIWGIC